MKVLITGSEGFVGSHLKKLFPDAFCMDLKDGKDCSSVGDYPMAKIDVIFHLAADLSPTDDRDIDMNRMVQSMWKASGAHLVYTSSAAVYEPNNLYAIQKLYGEEIFKGASILRLFNVYGERGSGIVDIIKENDDIEIHGNGEQIRDYIHVEDVVEALITAGNMKWTGTTDIGTGVGIIVNKLMELAGKDGEYVDEDPGVLFSISQSSELPWKAKRNIEDYYEKT